MKSKIYLNGTELAFILAAAFITSLIVCVAVLDISPLYRFWLQFCNLIIIMVYITSFRLEK